MNTSVRTWGFIGAVLLAGGTGGVVLGNFVTANGAGRPTGADELAAYWSEAGAEETSSSFEDRAYSSAAMRDGPSSYHCEGCDAGLNRHRDYLEPMPADYAPLPPYEAVDLQQPTRPAPAARVSVSPPSAPLRVQEPVPAKVAARLAAAPVIAAPLLQE
ncbi:hypothetical protein [Sphingobium sp. B11D3D]|uniref:hypothetical protein n=1 Tax=Sphingobium sp. B11D3D TaxID=2940576 RepID=UPI0022241BD9|nr:hypothetical protein [Sphingobium sp. B11D3D]MCW2370590.1 hypothetical protein [Sphingobium sp. B11D3D]